MTENREEQVNSRENGTISHGGIIAQRSSSSILRVDSVPSTQRRTRIRFDVQEPEIGDQGGASPNTNGHLLNESEIEVEIQENGADTAEEEINDIMSTRSRSSSVSGVKWKAVIDEVAGGGEDEEDYRTEEESQTSVKTGINSLLRFLDDLMESSTYANSQSLVGILQTIKSLADSIVIENSDQKRKYKNEITKLREKIERLKEKVEVNIHMDSRIQDQNARMKELENQNIALKKLCGQKDFDDDNEIDGAAGIFEERITLLQEENSKLRQKYKFLKKEYQKLTKQNLSPVSTSKNSFEDRSLVSEEVYSLLKQNNENLRKTSDQLIRANETLLLTNQALQHEFSEARSRFQSEQEQWKKNWEMLKLHYELQYTSSSRPRTPNH